MKGPASFSGPRRSIADFVIGAHAAKAGSLATFDCDFCRKTFPEVVLVEIGGEEVMPPAKDEHA